MIQGIVASGIGGLLAGAISAALLMGWYKDAIWENSVNEIKLEALNVLIAETDKVITLERVAQARVRELEAQHAQEEKNLDEIQRRNRALATELGGLRDPGRRPSGPDAVSDTATSTEGAGRATDPALLSAEATAVLLDASAEADALANYAKTCYDWKETVKRMFPPEDVKEEQHE